MGDNKISLIWEELKILLEDDEDFEVISIKDDFMKIKTLNKEAFLPSYVHCKIFSHIIFLNCYLVLNSVYYQSDKIEDDYLFFEFNITTKNDLEYNGRLKIIK